MRQPPNQATDIDGIKVEIYRSFKVGDDGVMPYREQLGFIQRYLDENKGDERKCLAANQVLTEIVSVNARATMPGWRSFI
jgi:hypothetical protein